MGLAGRLPAQNIPFNAGNTGTFVFPTFITAAAPISQDILVTGAPAQVAWEIAGTGGGWTESVVSGHTEITKGGVTVALPAEENAIISSAQPVQISGGATATTTPLTFTLTVTDDGGSGTSTKSYTLSVRQPVDVMLVLDNSASMNCCSDDNVDLACTGCNHAGVPTRLERLKEAVSAFFTVGSTYFHINDANAAHRDRFGAVIFSGTLDVSRRTYVNDPTALNDYINKLATSGGTCIGGGLLSGIDGMTSQSLANRKKAMILFTDGEQNFNPLLLNGSNPVRYRAGDLPINSYNPDAPNPPYGTCMPFPASTPTFNTAFRNENPGIQVSTIGVNLPAGPANSLLVNLANPSTGAGGASNVSGGTTDFNYASFFTNNLVRILQNSSPQIVKEVTGTTVASGASVAFTVNDTVSKVSFLMFGDPQKGFNTRFNVRKNNQDVTALGRFVQRGTFGYWVLDYDARRRPGVPTPPAPGGEWTVVSDSRPGVRYMATCLVDDHRLRYNLDMGDPANHVIGQPIPLKVTLSYDGLPVTDATRVVVYIDRATDDPGTQLARLPIPQGLKNLKKATGFAISEDPAFNNLGQVKHAMLLSSNSAYVNALQPRREEIVLTNRGDGTYTADYSPSVTGVHQLTLVIEGQRTDIGAYYRTSTQSTVVRLRNFDLSKQFLGGERIMSDGKLVGYRFNILLKDKSGLLLGPAFESTFDLKSSSGEFSRVVDNLDGSYTVELTNLNNETNPNVELSMDGVPLYTGKAGDLASGGGNCPAWMPGWMTGLFQALGLSCWLGLFLLVLVLALIIWLLRRILR